MRRIDFSGLWPRAALALAALLASALQPLQAQTDPAANFPNKPIRMIVPFAAGGGNDIFARLVGAKASEFLGQQFVIENRPAAGGRIAAEFVANQPSDGYTIFVGASGVMSISAAVYPKLAYHPTRSFIPLTMTADFPLIATSPINIAPKTVRELVVYAKANPSKANYGTTSPAFTIATELLKLKSGMPGVGIPLKSSSEMILCVMQQNCLISLSDGPPAIPQIKDGKVRALAVTGAKRSAAFPDLPTVAEAGLPGFEVVLQYGIVAPAGTPRPIIAKLNAALREALAAPDTIERMAKDGTEPRPSTPEEYAADIDREETKWSAVVKASGAKAE